MRNYIQLLIILAFIGCAEKNSAQSEKEIEQELDYKMIIVSEQSTFSGPLALMKSEHHPIRLSQTDMKCGEFGGNTVLLKIYLNHSKSSLLMDYKKTSIECGENQNPIITEKKGIEIAQKERIMIQNCILELAHHKLSKEKIISNFGIRNSVIISDSSFVIEDWPSFEWPKFKELVETVLE